jgi:hypothetical protein
VVVWDAVNEREIVLLRNLPAFEATTIAAICKDRWEIELFFKALKQKLKVKSFVGASENALRIQIWTALIAILLLFGAPPILPESQQLTLRLALWGQAAAAEMEISN